MQAAFVDKYPALAPLSEAHFEGDQRWEPGALLQALLDAGIPKLPAAVYTMAYSQEPLLYSPQTSPVPSFLSSPPRHPRRPFQ